MPLIEFVFSREKCNKYAYQVAHQLPELITSQTARIQSIVEAYQQVYQSLQDSELMPLLESGVAYRHADMWPREKELVEVLLKKGLLKAVFATTTLGEGVNVPAQTVGFNAYEVMETDYRQRFPPDDRPGRTSRDV